MQNEESSNRPPYLIDSVLRALDALVVVEESGAARVAEVARRLGVAPSTAHRLLQSLVWRGFVVQDRVTKKYRPGKAMSDLAAKRFKETRLREVARPCLDVLFEEVGGIVGLLVRDDEGNARFIESLNSGMNPPVIAAVGASLPAPTIAGGKVLLAWEEKESWRALYPHGLPRLTVRTTVDFEALSVELAEVRRLGYAHNTDGAYLGFTALAAPVRASGGRVIASISIAAASELLTARTVPKYLGPLQQCCTRISQTLSRP